MNRNSFLFLGKYSAICSGASFFIYRKAVYYDKVKI